MAISSQRVALVTGAARGIGRAIALRLAQDGYAVAINHVSGPQQEASDPASNSPPVPQPAETLREAIAAAGGTAAVFRADISRGEARQGLIDQLRERFGRLDLLVNNAGVAPLERRDLLEATETSFDRLIAINLKGPYFLTQLAARWMIDLQKRGAIDKGRIAFITSISAYAASTNRGDYCISKAGLTMAAALWAAALAPADIPVVEIRPGIIATDMTAGVKAKYDALIQGGLMPQRRWGRPEDVAAVVSAFGRGDLDYSTGIAIDVSGGFQLRTL
jgi:NAD(P)-dependent dehydrogenase (short-subunit alcohol dehydrogenase family)